jgi:Leucine-rich repeat (LRR) protein
MTARYALAVLVVATIVGCRDRKEFDFEEYRRQNPPPVMVEFCGEVMNVNTGIIHCKEPGISDLSPLAQMTGLVSLQISPAGEVSDLSPLAGLTRLDGLVLNGNPVEDLSPLRELTNLEDLWLIDTPVSDISPLAGMSKLETLELSRTRVADISALANKPRLTRLHLDRTRVSDLSPLADAKSLEELWIGTSLVSDLSPLSELSQLKTISAKNTYVSRVPPLEGLTSLEDLSLFSSPVEDVSELRVSSRGGLSRLRRIDLAYTLVSDIDHLAELPALQSLDVHRTLVAPEDFEAFRGRRRDVKVTYGRPIARTDEAIDSFRAFIMGRLPAVEEDGDTDGR